MKIKKKYRKQLKEQGKTLNLVQHILSESKIQSSNVDEGLREFQSRYNELLLDNSNQCKKMELLVRGLSLEPKENQLVEKFSRLITEDFMKLANETPLSTNPQSILELHSIKESLQKVVNAPEIASKTTIAVAGGFSSGKSAFINTFMIDSSIKLSTGINPVTVIPNYILCAKTPQIMIHGKQGESAPLDAPLYDYITHKNIKDFGFDLRKAIPFITLRAPLEKDFFQNICLIDTPGYNPGNGTDATSNDHKASVSQISNATAMIWVLSIDSGTIPMSDIEFISNSGINEKNIYVVITKADIKPASEIEEILNEVSEVLEDEYIDCAGICAFSARYPDQDFGHKGQTLREFFKSQNQETDIFCDFSQRIDNVFNPYFKACTKSWNNSNRDQKVLTDFAFLIVGKGYKQLANEFHKSLDTYFNFSSKKTHFEALAQQMINIKKQMKSTISGALLSLGFSPCHRSSQV